MALYFKAYTQRKETEAKEWSQKMWQMGIYVKAAILTSVFPVGLYDKKYRLPDYPECPYTKNENNSDEMNEQQVQNERMRCYMYFKSFGKHT